MPTHTQYCIDLSKDEEIEIIGEEAGKIKPVLKSKRDVELVILRNLFEVCANNAKSIQEYNAALDCVGFTEGVGKGAEELEFTKEDIDYLRKGLEGTVGKRPPGWWLQ